MQMFWLNAFYIAYICERMCVCARAHKFKVVFIWKMENLDIHIHN